MPLSAGDGDGVRPNSLFFGLTSACIQARPRRLFVLCAREMGHRNRVVAEYLGRDETLTLKWLRERPEQVMREVSKILQKVK